MTPLHGLIALCGAVAILTIFALVDAYAVRGCFLIAHAEIGLPEFCSAEHLFRTSIEIGGMAIGLYGAGTLIGKARSGGGSA
jgi:hypothetical protein